MLFIRHPTLYKKYHMHLKGFKSQRYGSRTASYPWLCNSSYTNLVGWPSPPRCTSYSYSVVLTNFICPLFLKLGSSRFFFFFLGLCATVHNNQPVCWQTWRKSFFQPISWNFQHQSCYDNLWTSILPVKLRVRLVRIHSYHLHEH